MNKKNKIWTTIFFIVIFTLWMIWGNTSLQVSHFTISDSEIPESFDGYKIAHVSDLHNKFWGETLVEPIEEEKPDLIVITGDLIDFNDSDIYAALEFVGRIQEVAPIYFVTGNHEAGNAQYPMLAEGLLNLGVTILANERVTLNKQNEQMLLMGIQDPAILGEEDTESNVQEVSEDYEGYKILLTHRPEFFHYYYRNEVDLVFAGHAHGGQVRLPFIGGLIAPGQGFFPKYTTGVYEEEDTKMVVSRGLGSSKFPIRMNNRAELIFVQLEREH